MEQEYTITAFSENSIGLLNRITIIFTRRRLNIESLTVSASAIRGIHKFTIVVNSTREQVQKVVKQIEKQVEVLKCFYHVNDEIVSQEIALYKVSTKEFMLHDVEPIMRKYGARVLEITPDFAIIEKTGHKADTTELFEVLEPFKVSQFTRSGRIAVTKEIRERLNDYLDEIDRMTRNKQECR
jgi:acetolactate synthase-1/3 small subunit